MSDQLSWKRIATFIPFCGIMASLAGLIALCGWFFKLAIMASLGSGLIPMAPSTAVLFLLYGTVSFLQAIRPDNVAIRRVGTTIFALGALAALTLLILSYRGIYLAAELLGLSAFGTVAGQPTGHMSPLTALCFLLASLSFLASARAAEHGRWMAAAVWLSRILFAVSSILVLAYLYGTPLMYDGSLIPPAASTSGAFLFLAVALMHSAGRRNPRVETFPTTGLFSTRLLMVVFVFLSAGIVTAGFLLQKNFEKRYRSEVERQLGAIANLKVKELARCRRELLADSAVFFNNPVFIGFARSFLNGRGDARTERAVMDRLERILSHDQYIRVDLLDSAGIRRLTAPKSRQGKCSNLGRDVTASFRAGKSILRDFYRDVLDGKVYLSVVTPLFDTGGDRHPVGAIQVVVDPDIYIYPFINEWPTSSRTAETLLIRREGRDVLFLNELRFRKDTALSLRVPIRSNAHQTAVQAVLGTKGIAEGIDYRGIPVISYIQQVPDSTWYLVSRMDLSEVYAPVRERLWVMITLVAALLLSTGVGMAYIWRRQNLLYYRERSAAAEALEQKNSELERFAYTISHDLKSPLVTIKTFLGYLREDLSKGDADRIAQDVNYIHTAAGKMGQLLDELLEMSRIGRMVNPPERVALRTVVQEALDMVAGGVAGKGIDIRLSDTQITLFGDRARLVEIWQNLLENSVKYMGDQQSPRIEIGTELAGGETEFFVRDNGIGIDPRFREKVFGLFEKLDPNSEGTGLGLALVKRIVEMYRGTIRVESEGAGRGACFRFTLPGAVTE